LKIELHDNTTSGKQCKKKRMSFYCLLPKSYLFEWTLGAFWLMKLGEVEDQRWQLFESKASFGIA